ncbi:GNAT family N-acetyltransferase [Geminicoccus roseus]|uniref:GNAT family N-acetyltransferase n=1 Tax=Geminicoccus roseus TaxID=404900 RepID=UPI0005531D47|nr:GNAT family N-acetyltransferase [Geminicoccus roseus]
MTIRTYRPADAASVTDIYRRAVERIGSRYYEARQVRAWAALAPSPERLDALTSDGRVRLVAVDEADRPLAFADLEARGRIHFLYCAPEAAGTGVASALYEALERAAGERGIDRLWAEASEAARPFFLAKGFALAGRRDFEVAGVPIHNYAMEKSLAG